MHGTVAPMAMAHTPGHPGGGEVWRLAAQDKHHGYIGVAGDAIATGNLIAALEQPAPDRRTSRAHKTRGTGLLTTVGVALTLIFSLAFTVFALGFIASSALSGKWADALSAVQDGFGGLIGLVVVLYLWRRYGFTRIKEGLSLAALEHDEAGKRYWELHLSEQRLGAEAAQAELAAQRATGLDHERLQAKANEARAVAIRVAGEAAVAKEKFVAAIRALVERYPNDTELADELARYSAPSSEHDPGERPAEAIAAAGCAPGPWPKPQARGQRIASSASAASLPPARQ